MKHRLILSTLALSLASVSASEVVTVRLPDGALQPRTVSVGDGSTVVVFLQGNPQASEVKLATLNNAGALDTPVTINTPATEAIAMGTVRGPSIAVGSQGIRQVLWHGKGGTAADGKGSALYYARVNVSGKTTPPQDVMGTTTALDGGAAIAADAAGHVWLVWHALPAGKAGESERRLFIRQSSNNGATFSEPWPVKGEDMGICGCCGLAAITDATGSLQVLYRTAEKSSQRGVRLIRLPVNATAATVPVLLKNDHWNMSACPMTTATLLPGTKETITAWITGFEMQFFGWNPTDIGGKKAVQNHPRLARNAAGETLLIWTEAAAWGKGGELASQIFSATSAPLGIPQRQPLPTWSYGACATLADGRFAVLY